MPLSPCGWTEFDQIAKQAIKELDDQMGCGEEFYRCIKRFIPLFFHQLRRSLASIARALGKGNYRHRVLVSVARGFLITSKPHFYLPRLGGSWKECLNEFEIDETAGRKFEKAHPRTLVTELLRAKR